MELRTCTVDVRLVHSAEPRPTMLLIHGIGVSGTYFLPFAATCIKKYNVHIIDMPGYGRTPGPRSPLAPRELAEVAAAYIREARLQNVIVVGQSMGCQTATHLAVRYPELCSKLVLIGPTVNAAERSLIQQGFRLLLDTFREPMQANAVIFRDYIRMGPLRYLKTARLMVRDHLETYINEVQLPMLIVRGSRDDIAPRRWVNDLAQRSK